MKTIKKIILAAVFVFLLASYLKVNGSEGLVEKGKELFVKGKEYASDWLEEHPEVKQKAKNTIKEKVGEKLPELVEGITETLTGESAGRDDDAVDLYNGPYSVTRVVDGDTLVVNIDGTDTKVRLIKVRRAL